MRLLELGKRRPREAGKARIVYSDITHPIRQQHTINIPNRPQLELFRLQPYWNQFLIIDDDRIWFGGTDENPFLVRINDGLIRSFLKSRNALIEFYGALVPHAIRSISSVLSAPSYRRQGDIFALPLPFSLKEIRSATKLVTGEEPEDWISKKLPLFNTRHQLAGHGLYSVEILGMTCAVVAEGKVTAPDHSPIELEGPHVFAQTANLFDPENAD